jgi:hypothetical protein
MRTKTLLAAAAMLAAGLASSLAQSNVYSLNVVGYVNKTIIGGSKYSAVANPLTTSSNTLGGLLTGTLPTGSQVLKFNTGTADYDIYNRVAFGNGWSPASGATTSMNPGEGVLIFVTAAGNVTNTFVGEVLQGTLTNPFVTGYQQKGNMVPDSGSVTNLGFVPPNSSQLLKWNPAVQDFDIFNKVIFGSGWSPSVPNLEVAESFLLLAPSPFNWVRNFTVQ